MRSMVSASNRVWAGLALRGVWRYQVNQAGLRHHLLHLSQELPLARAIRAQAQAKVSLLHAVYRLSTPQCRQARFPGAFADLP